MFAAHGLSSGQVSKSGNARSSREPLASKREMALHVDDLAAVLISARHVRPREYVSPPRLVTRRCPACEGRWGQFWCWTLGKP